MPATNPGTTGLSAWWSLNEASGTRVDAHSTNDLTPVNAPGSATGKVGDALDLESSSDQYLTIAAGSQSGLSAASGSFSFGAWYKMESSPTSFICSKRDGSAAEFTMTTDNTDPGGLYLYMAPGFVPHAALGVFPTGVWVFAVVGYNGAIGHACISINGAAPTSAARGGFTTASAPFNIGYDLSTGLPKWDGMIDEAFYYDRWLTDDELLWLYNGGNGRSYSDVAGTSSAKGLPILMHHHHAVFGGG